jgi:digeranylgeranylglycerophospholipid reductase
MAAEYDLIVVGGGPAGSSAAKAAAEKGIKVIVFEEHPAIGLPRHCTGRLAGTTLTNLSKTILETMNTPIVITKYKARRFFTPSGTIIGETPIGDSGCCLIIRDVFDRELARQAVDAGADIVLSTKVTGLLKTGERTTGVITNSTIMPKVYSKVVIAADGLYAADRGIPKWEGLASPPGFSVGGVQLELARVRDIKPDVLEVHGCSFSSTGFVSLWPLNSSSCILSHINKLEDFKRIKSGNYAVSKKLRDAIPLRMMGHSEHLGSGTPWPKIVKDGLMLVGDAAGWVGMIRAIISGRLAGDVAATAVQQGNVGEANLSRYNVIYDKLKVTQYDRWWYDCRNASDEVIENLMREKAQTGQLNWFDELPF